MKAPMAKHASCDTRARGAHSELHALDPSGASDGIALPPPPRDVLARAHMEERLEEFPAAEPQPDSLAWLAVETLLILALSLLAFYATAGAGPPRAEHHHRTGEEADASRTRLVSSGGPTTIDEFSRRLLEDAVRCPSPPTASLDRLVSRSPTNRKE